MLTETILLAQNKQLRERVDELEETVRQLTSESNQIAALPAGLPYLTRREEAVLRALLERRGTVSRERIHSLVYGDEDRSIGLIGVWVMKLRRKLADSGIEIKTDWGRGFYIDRGQSASAAGEAEQFIAEMVA